MTVFLELQCVPCDTCSDLVVEDEFFVTRRDDLFWRSACILFRCLVVDRHRISYITMVQF